MTSPASSRRPLARWLRRIALTLVAFELLYLVAGNAFLWSELGRRTINRKPEKLTVSWDRAWTVAPFWVHLRGLGIDANARAARWTLTADAARFNVWLPSLAFKHLRLLDTNGRGVEVEIEIDRVEPEGPRPEKKRRWRFTLGGGDVTRLERLRVDDLELRGPGTVRGSADVQIRGPVEIDIDRIAFENGQLTSRGTTVASAIDLDAGLEIGPFVVAEVGARELLAVTSGDVELETRTESLAFVNTYLDQARWLRIGGAGHLVVDAGLRDGRLTPASTLALTDATLEASLIGLRAHGEGELLGRVPAETSRPELALALASFSVDRSDDGRTLVEGENLRLVTTSESTALQQAPEGISLAAELSAARAPDLAAFAGLVPEASAVELTGGAGELSGEVRFDSATGEGDGGLRLVAERVSARYGDLVLRFDLDLDLALTDTRLDEGTTALDGSRLHIDGARVEGSGEDSADWWARVRIPQGRLWGVASAESAANGNESGAEAARRLAFDARVEAEMRDTRPLVAVLVERKPTLGWFDGLLTVEDVDASGRLRMAGHALGLHDLAVLGGDTLELLAEVDASGPGHRSGVLFARYRRLSAAVELADGERDWKLIGSRAWYERAAAEHQEGKGPGE